MQKERPLPLSGCPVLTQLVGCAKQKQKAKKTAHRELNQIKRDSLNELHYLFSVSLGASTLVSNSIEGRSKVVNVTNSKAKAAPRPVLDTYPMARILAFAAPCSGTLDFSGKRMQWKRYDCEISAPKRYGTERDTNDAIAGIHLTDGSFASR